MKAKSPNERLNDKIRQGQAISAAVDKMLPNGADFVVIVLDHDDLSVLSQIGKDKVVALLRGALFTLTDVEAKQTTFLVPEPVFGTCKHCGISKLSFDYQRRVVSCTTCHSEWPFTSKKSLG